MKEISFDYSELTAINQIIYRLYDNSIPLHTRVLEFLNSLTDIVYFDRGSIIFYYLNDEGMYQKHSSISVNWDNAEDYIKMYNEHYCHIDDIFPAVDMSNSIIFKSSEFFDQELRQQSTYWKEYLCPNNCIYSIDGNLLLNNNNGLKGCFNFYRGIEKKDFSDKDLMIIKLLQPHLSIMLREYGQETDSTSILFMLENDNCVGFGMLSDDYQLIRSNSTFKQLTDDSSNEIFDMTVKLCSDLNDKEMNSKVSSEYKFDDRPLYMEVSKINEDGYEASQYYALIYDLSYFFAQALNKAKDQYTLTEREFQIFKHVVAGKSNEKIASEMFISVPTVKKYLASIYEKMEIKSQKQILSKLNLL